jgi:hypothetical protein
MRRVNNTLDKYVGDPERERVGSRLAVDAVKFGIAKEKGKYGPL